MQWVRSSPRTKPITLVFTLHWNGRAYVTMVSLNTQFVCIPWICILLLPASVICPALATAAACCSFLATVLRYCPSLLPFTTAVRYCRSLLLLPFPLPGRPCPHCHRLIHRPSRRSRAPHAGLTLLENGELNPGSLDICLFRRKIPRTWEVDILHSNIH